MIEDPSADEFARGAGIDAFAAMYRVGMIRREEFSEYLGSLLAERLERDAVHPWNAAAAVCADFRLVEHLDSLRAADAAGFLDPMYDPIESLERRIQAEGNVEEDQKRYRLVDSAADEMSWWACYAPGSEREEAPQPEAMSSVVSEFPPQEPDLEMAPADRSGWAEPREPYRRAMPKVGRNDPCPCGSGKKFKKCCGK